MDRGLTAGYVDTLFRPANPAGSPVATTTPAVGAPTAPAPDVRGEAGRIVSQAATSDLAPADRTYLAGIVAARTGLSQADAEARVDQVTTKAKQDADTARKAASSLAFLTALSLLIGAFVAAAGGALGGYHRDEI
jgi:hypothetical protein